MQDGKPYDFKVDLARRIENQLEAMAILRGTTVDEMKRVALDMLAGRDMDTPQSGAETAGDRALSELEVAQVTGVKELGSMLLGLFHEIGGTDPDGDRLGSRDLALAATHVEDGVMRAVRHITS